MRASSCCARCGLPAGQSATALSSMSHTCTAHEDVREARQRQRRPDEFLPELRRLGNRCSVVLIDMGKVVLACHARPLAPALEARSSRMMIAGADDGAWAMIFPAFCGFRGGKGILSSGCTGDHDGLAHALSSAVSLFLIIVLVRRTMSRSAPFWAATAYAVLFVILFPRTAAGSGAAPLLMAVLAIFMHREQYFPSAPRHGDKNLSFEIQEKVRNLPCR